MYGMRYKGGVGEPYNTQNPVIARRGGLCPLPELFWRICRQCTIKGVEERTLQSAYLSPKSDNLPPRPKCALLPQNRSFNHISLSFSLTKLIYPLLSKNVTSRIFALLLAKFAKVPGLGGGGSTQFWQCQHFGCIWSRTSNPPLTCQSQCCH